MTISQYFQIQLKTILRPLLALLINMFKVEDADFGYYDNFDYWQNRGFYIIPKHFYQPIPDTSEIESSYFKRKFSMVGVNMDEKKQLQILDRFKKFDNEYSAFKKIKKGVDDQDDPNFYFNNLAFDGVDALVYYCMIRTVKPDKIIEVGSGWSTKVAAQACIKNGNTKLMAIEPYPQPILAKGFVGLSKLIRKKVQDVRIEHFKTLKANDILFIDSSHTVKTAGDVNYLFLEVLPNLKRGVYIHIHDIFFPFDYPKEWVLTEHRFWAEQYILHAFLLFNDSFKVVYANNYMFSKYLSQVRKTFPLSPMFSGGSVWLQKIR
ncbi:MAG: hypothetical protein US96_C0005G0010 [Candidatus Woesebacteria bacterium GW2011_GWB1_38_5b]|uniref:Class I SAM-dependent methyltransferase n=1 Tax=Candidatus Woesebacteria bacterium GW2011_GWB1_38_5b TaxID=1618569 RepID=A0A0G0KA88_9BACT|nr:MAG: hypothetical protein US96_C0005G0010 [Candidatus Woesebacteria bacterium GW2011_GWB1_38_5b]